ncbi:unnamed protein product [Cyprideis torosa]|uniref:Uncharacterized protein n=1 Tax=Cyprideis torosa TaxID=163714 RepID=A0A7R8ZRD7_9CRUS|nr:unnamed protein product [Cyprideis torosa]CAG0904857.1 unnamed protein product [Cyprideis torosa]
MKTLVCILIAGLLVANAEGSLEIPKDYRRPEPYPGQCDSPFTAVTGGHCYFRSYRLLRLSWGDAQSACQQLHPRGTLAEFESVDEILDATLFLMDSNNCSDWQEGPSDAGPWIGGLEVSDSNEFAWGSTNTSILYTNWNTGEPNSPGFEDGIALNCAANFEWQDVAAEVHLPFLCEIPPNAPTIALTCPEGFILLGESCYALRDEQGMNWDDSQTYCASLAPGGKLIEIETAEEFYAVFSYLRENPPPSCGPAYWIGAEEREGSDYFEWASTRWPVLFYNWYYNQPHDSTAGNAIRADCTYWEWFDAQKSTPGHQLCEAPPTEEPVDSSTRSGSNEGHPSNGQWTN